MFMHRLVIVVVLATFSTAQADTIFVDDDLVGFSEVVQHRSPHLVPHPGLLPVPKATPASHAGPAAHLLWQILPRNAGPQYE